MKLKHLSKQLILNFVIPVLFCMGYDVFVTHSQQLLAWKMEKQAIGPVSAWMYIIYLAVPFLLPTISHLRKLKLPYIVQLLILLALFYFIEAIAGYLLGYFGIRAWNYQWWLDPMWSTPAGYNCWHPVIILEWVIFIYLLEKYHFTISRRIRLKSFVKR